MKTKSGLPRGFALLEMVLVLLILVMVGGISANLLITFLRTMNSQHARAEISLEVLENLENKVVQPLRLADQTQVSGALNDRIDYRVRIGVTTFYALYFYNSNNSGLGTYNQTAYSLLRATTSALGSAFPYGTGDILMRDLSPPPTFYTSVAPAGGKAIVLDLTLIKSGETYRVRQEVYPRN